MFNKLTLQRGITKSSKSLIRKLGQNFRVNVRYSLRLMNRYALYPGDKTLYDKCNELKGICKGFNFVRELATLIRQLAQEAGRAKTLEESAVVDDFINSLKAIVDSLTDMPMVSRAVSSKIVTAQSVTAKDLLKELADLKARKTDYTRKSDYSVAKKNLRRVIFAKMEELQNRISALAEMRMTDTERSSEILMIQGEVKALEQGLSQNPVQKLRRSMSSQMRLDVSRL